jgi:hypothetical protein
LTDRWRHEVAEQDQQVAAGTLAREHAYAAMAWPPAFIDAVDARLTAYEREVAQLGPAPTDQAVWRAVERVVLALNDVQTGIDTMTREELCEYIDDVVTAAGVDVEAVTERRDLDRSQLTDQWRDF